MLRFLTRAKWDCDLISIKDPEELKKVCNTLLDEVGTLGLEEKLQSLQDSIIELYDVAADLRLIEIFGQEFAVEHCGKIESLYKLHTNLQTPQQRCTFICNVYKHWIMKYSIIFPKY
jgi:hypothetical protein